MTTIEGWEVERHHAILRRARVLGGYLNGPDGSKVWIEHQEFPFDVGIWKNIRLGMGTSNPLVWFWPFARSPAIETALNLHHNLIDDPSKPWPPPDPDRLFRAARKPLEGTGFTHAMDIESFRARQAADLARYEDADGEYIVRRRPFHERLEDSEKLDRGSGGDGGQRVYEIEDDDEEGEGEVEPALVEMVQGKDGAGEEGWRNKEGERLADFGVDEVADFYDEDDLPLAELLRRRQGLKAQ
ncbi:Palmitoyltransferase [Recurvomyces mirabilis]|uniref:Palmitoyltransferase n=1 Tax=Recurvomyces mirabilis TaxID=574656 RepID=A0AAE0WPN8_9PEZI|nr:Palmitoyltransferase [Recurvomyces mirabilis]KAK5156017.1 Palmitoyltransferase [Recurvomyces mirabilis]